MPVKGIDIYHGDIITSFHDLYADGVLFAYLKATQGANYIDPNFASNIARAKEVGMLTTGYCFFTPGDDPIKQAQHLINVANPVSGMLPLILDIETYGPHIAEMAQQAANEIKRLTGYYPWIYSGESFYGQYLASTFPADDYGLIIANYSQQPKVACRIWQNSETGRLIGAQNDVDTDVFNGDIEQLQALCIK